MNKAEKYLEQLFYCRAEGVDNSEISISFKKKPRHFFISEVKKWFIAGLIIYPLLVLSREDLRSISIMTHITMFSGFMCVIVFLILSDMINAYNVDSIKFTQYKLTLVNGCKKKNIYWENIEKAKLYYEKNNLWSFKLKKSFWAIKFNLTGFIENEQDYINAIIIASLPETCKLIIK